MSDALKDEVDKNYDFFQRNLQQLIEEHADKYVLLKSAEIVDFYEGPGTAYRAGLSKFPDKIFSVQRVTNVPDELGLMSVALTFR